MPSNQQSVNFFTTAVLEATERQIGGSSLFSSVKSKYRRHQRQAKRQSAGISRNSRIVGKAAKKVIFCNRSCNQPFLPVAFCLSKFIATLFSAVRSSCGNALRAIVCRRPSEYQMHVSFTAEAFQKPSAAHCGRPVADFVLYCWKSNRLRVNATQSSSGFVGSGFTAVDEEHMHHAPRNRWRTPL